MGIKIVPTHFKWDNTSMILASDINTSLIAYYLDFINAWLLSKSKPNSLHPYVLSHISPAFLWILLCASNSSPGCPSGLPWQSFPVLPSFILLSPCLSWNLSPSQVQHSPCVFFFFLWFSQDVHRTRSSQRPAFLCFRNGTSSLLHSSPFFEVYVCH